MSCRLSRRSLAVMTLSVALPLAALSTAAQAQTAPAITYPSVARSPAPAVQSTAQPLAPATVRGERSTVERARVSTEPAHSAFVYERLGATPTLKFMRERAVADLADTGAVR